MRVAVTGATGMVGGQVVRAALEAGHEVVTVVRPGPGSRVGRSDADRPDSDRPDTVRLERRAAGLGDAEALTGAMAGCDALVHCAAVYAFGAGHAEEVARVNEAGTRTVLQAAARAGVGRAVVTSSSVTCGSGGLPLTRSERDHLGGEPAPAYYASKVAQEAAALEVSEHSGIPVVLALPTVVLGGPFTRLAPSNAIVLRYLLDPTRSTFPGGCNVVDARDVGTGHLLLLERGIPGERYLLGGEDLTWRTLHTIVADLAGLPGPFAELTAPSAWAAAAGAELWARVTGSSPLSTRDEASTVGRFYWYSSAKAEQLGYAARPARAAVAASLAWLCVSPELPRWVREGLRLHAEVRSARALVPRRLTDDERGGEGPGGDEQAGEGPAGDGPAASAPVSPRPRRSPPAWPRPHH